MSNPILAMIPSGYKGLTATAPQVYSVLPSDGSGDFTFDRANGLATRINKDGLIYKHTVKILTMQFGLN